MACVWLNCHSTVHTQTQTRTETDEYRKHVQREFVNQSIKGTTSKVLVDGIAVVEIQIMSVFTPSSLFLVRHAHVP